MKKPEETYIVLSRKLSDAVDLSRDLEMTGLLVHLLLRARFKTSTFKVNGEPQEFPPGTLLLTYRDLSEKHGVGKDKARSMLNYLEKRGTIQIHNKGGFSRQEGTVISFVNWDAYQFVPEDDKSMSRQESDKDQTKIRQESDINQTRIRPIEQGNNGTREQGEKGKILAGAPTPRSVVETGGSRAGEGKAGEERQGGGNPGDQTQLELNPEIVPPAHAHEGLDDGAVFHVEQSETEKPEKPAESEDEKARRIELAVWCRGVYFFAKMLYTESGLNPLLFPTLTDKLRGRIRVQIEKLGLGDLRAGAQRLMRAIIVNAEFYKNPDTGKINEFWFPTLDAMLTNEKIARLMPEVDGGAWKEGSEIEPTAQEFYANAKAAADELESSYRQMLGH